MKLQYPLLFKQKNYINGQWLEAEHAAAFEVINPFDQSIIGHVPKMGSAMADAAISAAYQAFSQWQSTTAKERATLILRWAKLIEHHQADLALIMTLEQGKPLAESVAELNYANSFNYWFAEEAKRTYGDVIPTIANDRRLVVIKQPLGVCAAITPWNFPCAMVTRKCAPALAAGCTMVLKPAESTPFSALALAVLAEEAGFPAGVLNVITGDPVAIGHAFTQNPLVNKLSFTGSTRVGKLLMQQSSHTVKKLSLELGGNAPFIIFEDADLKAAHQGVMLAKFRNSGQACVAANRIYVHERYYDVFVKSLVAQVKVLKVGSGLERGTLIGPLINQAAIAKVSYLVEDAVSKGAKIACGGKIDPTSSNAYQPTVLVDIPPSAVISNEEIFGPVAPIYRFRDEAQVIAEANQTRYGLAGYFYSRDIGRVWRVAEALDYGMVSINHGLFSNEVAPFGGVKESGFGREGSKYGIEDYLKIKYLCIGL